MLGKKTMMAVDGFVYLVVFHFSFLFLIEVDQLVWQW